MGKTLHWNMCRKKGISEKRYEHKPLLCTENESFQIFWDFNIQSDNIIEHARPDMIIVDKTNRIVEFTVPADHRIEISQQRKIKNYPDLKRELQKMWNLKISIMSVVIGTLRTIPNSLEKHLNKLKVDVKIFQMQTSFAMVMSKVLEFYRVLLTVELQEKSIERLKDVNFP